MTPEQFKKQNTFRQNTERICLKCVHFVEADEEAREEERSRRVRDHEPPRWIDHCSQTTPPFLIGQDTVCDAFEPRYKYGYVPED